jgi:DNA-binding CsgD family transcriptional regulator
MSLPFHVPAENRLTPREAEVLQLTYMSNADIAAQLGIARATVRTLLNRAFIKLGAETRTAALLLWQERRAA